MSDTNVGLGMVPCRPNCRCNDCTIERQRNHIATLEAQLAAVRRLNVAMWQAGYARGHNDTVEGCYNAGWEVDPEAAEESADELEAALGGSDE